MRNTNTDTKADKYLYTQKMRTDTDTKADKNLYKQKMRRTDTDTKADKYLNRHKDEKYVYRQKDEKQLCTFNYVCLTRKKNALNCFGRQQTITKDCIETP